MAKRFNPEWHAFDRWFPYSIGAASRRALDQADERRRAEIDASLKRVSGPSPGSRMIEKLEGLRIGRFYPSEKDRASASYSRQVVDFAQDVLNQLFSTTFVSSRGSDCSARQCGLKFCDAQSLSEEECVDILLRYLARHEYKFHPKLRQKSGEIRLFLWMCRQSHIDPSTLTLVIDGPADEVGPYVSI